MMIKTIEIVSSWTAAIWVGTLTVVVAVIPIWAWQKLNSVWLKPRRLERLLREQGLQGDPYKLSGSPDNSDKLMLQQEAINKSIGLSSGDVAPRVFSHALHTVDKYGKNSFYWEGTTTPRVIITEPEQIKHIFNKMHDFPKHEVTNPVAKLLSTGLPQYQGDKWATHRKIINPAFHLDKLKDMLPAFYQSCRGMITKWEGMLSSHGTAEIDVWPFLQVLSCDVISRTAFGSSYEEGTRIFELLQEQGHLLMTGRYRHIPGWWLLPKTTNRKLKENTRDMHASLKGIINKREKAMKDGENTNDDLLGRLLESNQSENQGHGNGKVAGMTDQELMEECKVFYLAGQETTSDLLVWTMILLARFPEWQERARQEALQVFGNENPDFDGLSRLKVVTMILYEVLRLYPPVLFFSRIVKKDIKLGNLLLPAGVKISLPILLIHHDHDLWGDDAKEFKPERFSEGIAKATKGQLSFFPFGWGPRICLGQNFALLEAKIALSLLLKNFSFELSPAYVHVPTTMLTLKPKHGAQIILHKL